jgi:hypothetical protein
MSMAVCPNGGVICHGSSHVRASQRISKVQFCCAQERKAAGQSLWGSMCRKLGPREQASWGNAWVIKPRGVKYPSGSWRGWGIMLACPHGYIVPQKWPNPVILQDPQDHSVPSHGLQLPGFALPLGKAVQIAYSLGQTRRVYKLSFADARAWITNKNQCWSTSRVWEQH